MPMRRQLGRAQESESGVQLKGLMKCSVSRTGGDGGWGGGGPWNSAITIKEQSCLAGISTPGLFWVAAPVDSLVCRWLPLPVVGRRSLRAMSSRVGWIPCVGAPPPPGAATLLPSELKDRRRQFAANGRKNSFKFVFSFGFFDCFSNA